MQMLDGRNPSSDMNTPLFLRDIANPKRAHRTHCRRSVSLPQQDLWDSKTEELDD